MRKVLVCAAALVPMAGAALAQPPRPHALTSAAELEGGDPPPLFDRAAGK